MKRYRVISGDLDSRAASLTLEIRESWEPQIRAMHLKNRENAIRGLALEFGEENLDAKIQNFIELGPAPFSILAFHNNFLRQVRNAFVIGSYYPALTGACALGERILNHLILKLRDSYKGTPEYKHVYNKDSFDDWDVAIRTLEAWNILLPDAAAGFRNLAKLRHRSIHFDPATDHNDRDLALQAIQTLSRVVDAQFTWFGERPWFIEGIKGASFIRKEFETNPFVRKIYLPNCALVGPKHTLEHQINENGSYWLVHDEYEYENREISDEEFAELMTLR